jgi:hypothetical protein
LTVVKQLNQDCGTCSPQAERAPLFFFLGGWSPTKKRERKGELYMKYEI